MAADDALSADEAAAVLGVAKETLYAYVSRGRLGSVPGPGPSRARRYPREDVEALLRRRARARDRGLAAHDALVEGTGLPVLDSALTLIAGGRCWYRGRDVVELSRSAGFEAVCALLWTGAEDPAPAFPASRARAGPPSAGALARHLARAGDPALVAPGSPGDVAVRDAARVVAGLFGAAGAGGAGPLAGRLARGWGTDRADALDAALVLCADHELNVSSFTARVVASAEAPLDQVVLAALCALRGRRHGGMTERVEALVRDAARDGAGPAAERALGDDGALPGFGHPLYPDGDPRAAELLRVADAVAPAPEGDPAAALVALARERLGAAPTLDLGLAVLARRLDLPPGAALCLFALGRSAGWIAHALEAWSDRRMIRPRSRYTGPPPAAVGSSAP